MGAISFNNIPATVRTPGSFTEVDNSRALQGLLANPHKVLLLGSKLSGTIDADVIKAMTNDSLADGFFGEGSEIARMCNTFKKVNPNTELYAMALSDAAAGVQGTGSVSFSACMSGLSFVGTGVFYTMVGGIKAYQACQSGWSVQDVVSAQVATINAIGSMPITASVVGSEVVAWTAKNKGENGNDIDIRFNYYEGQEYPSQVTDIPVVVDAVDGAGNPDIGDAWAVAAGTIYQYIGQPYTDAANLTSLENELADRFLPLEDKQGHAFGWFRGTVAQCSVKGNSRNSPHNTIMGMHNTPTCNCVAAANLVAVASEYLNGDPARPLTTLKLTQVLAPPAADRFDQSERNILLFDGIATWITDTADAVMIERCITTYQTNALGNPDASYLDVQTLATIGEIRYQYNARMNTRFIVPRFKLAGDTFPIQPGAKIAQPKTVKQEIIALFSLLQKVGLIEDLDSFITNLVVVRNTTDPNRVDVLLPPDLINQFRVLASVMQFIL